MLSYLIGLLRRSIDLLGKILIREFKLEFLTYMDLNALSRTALNNSASTLQMKSFNSISISMYSRWSRRNIREKKLIGVTLNLLTTKMFWI
nr:protein OPAQUE1 isoform X6 [Ipomoea batatas]